MSGRLAVVGLGPGGAGQMTGEAGAAIASASTVYGYAPYLDRLPPVAGQRRIGSGNGEEMDRAYRALASAAAGSSVCVVSGGDPGVFAMAAAVCEAIEKGPEAFRTVELIVVPGVTAMLAVAALVGAPLGHDFCAISLSDNLKPWAVIEKRLVAAAGAGMAIALYNPASRARPDQLGRAFEVLRGVLPAETPVVFGRAAGRADERVAIHALGRADPGLADMATCVIVGSAETRRVRRPGKRDIVYTPRGALGAE